MSSNSDSSRHLSASLYWRLLFEQHGYYVVVSLFLTLHVVSSHSDEVIIGTVQVVFAIIHNQHPFSDTYASLWDFNITIFPRIGVHVLNYSHILEEAHC